MPAACDHGCTNNNGKEQTSLNDENAFTGTKRHPIFHLVLMKKWNAFSLVDLCGSIAANAARLLEENIHSEWNLT